MFSITCLLLQLLTASSSFGYVEYTNAADAAKAYEAKKGSDLDGRTINLDYATGRQNKQEGGDRAQARAGKYGDQTSPASDTLFVGNLPFSASEDALRDMFSEQGSILGIRLPTDPESGRPKGFGYIQFSSVEEAKAAHGALNGEELEGRSLRLDFSTPRPANGDRGGFGGRGGGRGGGFGGRGGGGRGGGRGRGGFGGRGGGFGGRDGGFNKAKGSIPEFKGSKITF
jgi:nucleolin